MPDCNRAVFQTILPDVLPRLVELLNTNIMRHSDVRYHAVQALQNISLYDDDFRVAIANEPHCIERVVTCLKYGERRRRGFDPDAETVGAALELLRVMADDTTHMEAVLRFEAELIELATTKTAQDVSERIAVLLDGFHSAA